MLLAYPGTGKTVLAKKYKNVVDCDTMHVHPNEIWRTFLDNLETNIIAQPNLVLEFPHIDTSPTDLNIIIAAPHPSCADEYRERYANRGTPEGLARPLADRIGNYYNEMMRFAKFRHQKIVLKPGEFLETALRANGVGLVERDQTQDIV